MPADEKDATAAVVGHLERAAAARGVSLWEAARESLGAKVRSGSTRTTVRFSELLPGIDNHLVTVLR
jgi:hypothetical protein